MWVLNPKMPCKVKSSGEIVLMLKRPQKNKMQREKNHWIPWKVSMGISQDLGILSRDS